MKNRNGFYFIIILFLGFTILSCSTFQDVKDRLSEWFGDEDRELQTRRISITEFEDKLRGAWAGKMIGVSYGAPYEFQYNGVIQDEPIRVWQPEFVNNSLNQDDLYVQMTFLEALVDKGLGITSKEAGEFFKNTKYNLWHANKEARLNLQAGIFPPESGSPRYNPHANDIDFQIEADVFGIISPGMPVTGVRIAEQFGRIMNYGDGLYGGLFVSAMYSMAYFNRDRVRVIEAGLECIPPQSEYAQLIRDVLSYYQSNPEDWRGCWQMIEQKWAQNDICPEGLNQPFNIDAKINGGYVVAGLLYGEGDMAKTLEISTRLGQDSDCNPSTAAGILGCMIGYDRIPRQFTDGIPLLAGREFSYTRYSFDTLIPESKKMARAIIERYGGTVVRLGDRQYMIVPVQIPQLNVKFEEYTPSMHSELKSFHEQLPALRRERMQNTIQTRLNDWAPGWKISDWGHHMNPGYHQQYGTEFDVLITHPLNAETPCVLSWQGLIPSGNPMLQLRVAASDYAEDADWMLRVRINEQVVNEQIVQNNPNEVTWRNINLDLSSYAGQNATIQLENLVGISRYPAAAWKTISITNSP